MTYITFSVFFTLCFSQFLFASRILKQDDPNYFFDQNSNCNIKLLNSFIKSEITDKTRNISSLTKTQGICSNMSGTCCTDQEFDFLHQNALRTIEEISQTIDMHSRTVRDLASLSDEDFEAIFTGFDEEEVSSQFDIEKLKQSLLVLREDAENYDERAQRVFEFIVRSGSGIVCGVCAPENQRWTYNADDENSNYVYSIDLSAEECFGILQDEDMLEYGKLLDDMIAMYRVTFILNLKYQMKMEIVTGFVFTYFDNKYTQFKDEPCRDREYFFKDIRYCANTCVKFGSMNRNPLAFYMDAFTQNYLFIHDYANEKELLQNPLSTSESPAEKIVVDSTHDESSSGILATPSTRSNQQVEDLREQMLISFRQLKSKFEALYFLEPISDSLMTLITMRLGFKVEGGWKNKEFGFDIFLNTKIHRKEFISKDEGDNQISRTMTKENSGEKMMKLCFIYLFVFFALK